MAKELNELISRRGFDGTLADLILYAKNRKRDALLEADYDLGDYWLEVVEIVTKASQDYGRLNLRGL